MKYDDHTLNAYIDGELDAAEAEAIARDERADAQLRERLEQLRQCDHALREACEPIAQRPLPAAVTALLEKTAETPAPTRSNRLADMLQQLAGLLRPLPMPAAAVAASAAAALVLAYLVLIPGDPSGSPLPQRIEAGTALHAALQEQPSGTSVNVNGDTLRPLLSFRTDDGRYCREFVLTADTRRRRAVACAAANGWRVQASSTMNPATGDAQGYVPASGDSQGAVADFVDTHMAGIPFDHARERALIASGWDQSNNDG